MCFTNFSLFQIIICGIYAVSIYLSVIEGPNDGQVANSLGCIVFLLGMRNNLLSVIFGISFERALYWHKVISYVFMLTVSIHAVLMGIDFSGIVLAALCLFAPISYLFKNTSFELFYYSHIVKNVLIAIFCVGHGAPEMTAACGFWGLDLLARYCITTKAVTATATVIPGDVVKLRFHKTFDYKPGQYCFLMIQDINMFEYHPFSLSSSPTEEITSFHVRALGDWTTKLHAHVKAHTVNEPMKLDVSVEGPYGQPMININDPSYEVITI